MSVVFYTLTFIVIAGYLRSVSVDKSKTRDSFRYSVDILFHILPYLIIGIWLTGVLFAFIPESTIESILDDSNILFKIPLVCLVAMVFPGPRYIIYPLAAGLAARGVGAGIVVAYLTADVLIDPSCVVLESKMLGRRYYIFRFLLSLAIASLGGLITHIILPDTVMFN